MERKFKTTAKCAGCVKAIGEKLSKELAAGQWSIDLTSPDRVLTVAADTPSGCPHRGTGARGWIQD